MKAIHYFQGKKAINPCTCGIMEGHLWSEHLIFKRRKCKTKKSVLILLTSVSRFLHEF